MTPISFIIALKHVVARLLLQNMLDMLWPSRLLLMKLISSYSALTFYLMRNPRNTTFALTLFVRSHIHLLNHAQSGMNIFFSFLDNYSKPELVSRAYEDDENIPKHKTFLRIKSLSKLGRLIHPIFPLLIHLEILVTHFFCHPKNTAKSSSCVLLKLLMTTKKKITIPWTYPVFMLG